MASTAKFDVWQDTSGKSFYGARAWVNLNGTGTVAIRGSAGVSSITDLNVGRYQVNFSNSLPNANYSAVSTNETGGVGGTYSHTTTSLNAYVNNASFQPQDGTNINVILFA
jgi:hypothetical protein